MLLEVDISETEQAQIEKHIKEPLDALLLRVVNTRIRHLAKAARPQQPLGRPKVVDINSSISDLLSIYENLRTIHPEETFLLWWGAQEDQLRKAIREDDLDTIQHFLTTKPWKL